MPLKPHRTYEPRRGVLYTLRVLSAAIIALGAVCFLPV